MELAKEIRGQYLSEIELSSLPLLNLLQTSGVTLLKIFEEVDLTLSLDRFFTRIIRAANMFLSIG
jgi:hypothetical protein